MKSAMKVLFTRITLTLSVLILTCLTSTTVYLLRIAVFVMPLMALCLEAPRGRVSLIALRNMFKMRWVSTKKMQQLWKPCASTHIHYYATIACSGERGGATTLTLQLYVIGMTGCYNCWVHRESSLNILQFHWNCVYICVRRSFVEYF